MTGHLEVRLSFIYRVRTRSNEKSLKSTSQTKEKVGGESRAQISFEIEKKYSLGGAVVLAKTSHFGVASHFVRSIQLSPSLIESVTGLESLTHRTFHELFSLGVMADSDRSWPEVLSSISWSPTRDLYCSNQRPELCPLVPVAGTCTRVALCSSHADIMAAEMAKAVSRCGR